MCWCATPAAGTRPRGTPQHAGASCCAARCEAVVSMAGLRIVAGILARIEQAVEVDHEIAHMGVVDGLLRLRLPGRVRGRVIGKHADDFHLIEILEGVVLEIGQLTADDEMQQLRLGAVWHDSSSPYGPGKAGSPASANAFRAADDDGSARQYQHDDRAPPPPASRESPRGDYTGWRPPTAPSCYHSLPARSNWPRQGPSRGFGRRQRPRQAVPRRPGTTAAPASRSWDRAKSRRARDASVRPAVSGRRCAENPAPCPMSPAR